MYESPIEVLRVCAISENCLAGAYLGQLLQADRRMSAVSLKQYLDLSPAQRRNMIFAIDQCGLEIPLNEYIKRLRGQCLNPKFIVLDYEKSTDEIVRLLVMGAHGYLPHAEASRKLIPAVFAVARNEFWVPQQAFQEFLREVAAALRKGSDGRHPTTPRENEILELVRRRLSNKEIAEILQIRVSTVKFHVSNILSKLHVRSRHELTEAPSGDLWMRVWRGQGEGCDFRRN